MQEIAALPPFTFSKMQGLGNDFVVIDLRDAHNLAIGECLRANGGAARWILDRRWGIGGDQILTIENAGADADVAVEIWNSDGSQAEMCGNGVRVVALYTGSEIISTRGGIKRVQRLKDDQWRVAMGVPRTSGVSEFLSVGEGQVALTPVSMGNPHAVAFVEDVLHFNPDEFASLGRAIEMHERFAPSRTNVEFVQILSPQRLAVRVWERGAGATLACGTGACAAVVVAQLSGRLGQGVEKLGPVEVVLPGGVLRIEWEGAGHEVFMTGPANLVAQGQWVATGPYWTMD